MYLDSAYIVKFYVNEPDAWRVRRVIQSAGTLTSSIWAAPEVTCSFLRKVREGRITQGHYHELLGGFRAHIEAGLWTLLPISDRLLRRLEAVMRNLPPDTCLRAGDALHLITASDLGESEIWSNDRRLLAAAPYFGLTGRSA